MFLFWRQIRFAVLNFLDNRKVGQIVYECLNELSKNRIPKPTDFFYIEYSVLHTSRKFMNPSLWMLMNVLITVTTILL